MNTEIIVAFVAMALGLAFWLRDMLSRSYATRLAAPALYRRLEAARDELFAGSRLVRFTVFRFDRGASKLVPFARLGWGRPAEHSLSFAADEGLIGEAFSDATNPIVVGEFAPVDDDNSGRLQQVNQVGIANNTAEQLSRDQLRNVRVTITVRLQSARFVGALCIDSKNPLPDQVPESLWAGIWNLASTLPELVDERSDEPVSKTRTDPPTASYPEERKPTVHKVRPGKQDEPLPMHA